MTRTNKWTLPVTNGCEGQCETLLNSLTRMKSNKLVRNKKVALILCHYNKALYVTTEAGILYIWVFFHFICFQYNAFSKLFLHPTVRPQHLLGSLFVYFVVHLSC